MRLLSIVVIRWGRRKRVRNVKLVRDILLGELFVILSEGNLVYYTFLMGNTFACNKLDFDFFICQGRVKKFEILKLTVSFILSTDDEGHAFPHSVIDLIIESGCPKYSVDSKDERHFDQSMKFQTQMTFPKTLHLSTNPQMKPLSQTT